MKNYKEIGKAAAEFYYGERPYPPSQTTHRKARTFVRRAVLAAYPPGTPYPTAKRNAARIASAVTGPR